MRRDTLQEARNRWRRLPRSERSLAIYDVWQTIERLTREGKGGSRRRDYSPRDGAQGALLELLMLVGADEIKVEKETDDER
jgi:hypothetical protein